MARKNRIVIVEDHTILRDGLKSLIALTPDLEVVGEAEDGLQALKVIESTRPDLILLDLSMPKMDGFGVIADVKRSFPDSKIVVLTVHRTEEYVRRSLEAGADGYVLKKSTRDELLSAIHHVLEGDRYLYPGISNQVIQGYLGRSGTEKVKSLWDTLTRREREVLKLIAEGNRNKEIADYLCISTGTVEVHRNNIMKKLDLHNVASLTNYAIDQGLITD